MRTMVVMSVFAILFVPAFGDEEWIEPTRDIAKMYVGTLEYDKIPEGFECDVSPKIFHDIVAKQTPVEIPEYDSMVLRVGGEGSTKDLEMEISLWYDEITSAEDLSYDISLRTENGSKIGGGVYSPDAYSVYYTLGVAIEANSKTTDGILPSDARNRLGEVFGDATYTSYGVPTDGSYNLYVRVFDSENDWISSDRCGIQTIIPFSASNEDVEIGTIQFSNIKVSELETNLENLEEVQQIIEESVLAVSDDHPDVYLEWLEASYSSTGTGVVRVVVPDMNLDPKAVDNFDVYVWSDSDAGGIAPTVTETGADTGIFEGTVFFSETEESSGHRLHVADGDTIGAEYKYSTVPGSDSLDMISVSQEIMIKNPSDIEQHASPLQQWKQGESPVEIDCRDGRFLMINPINEKPACLFPSSFSMIRFAENGWMPVRNLVLENPVETIVSGHGGDFTERYFSYFEINDENSILLHDVNNKDLVHVMNSGEKIISNCHDTGANIITIHTLDEVNLTKNTATFTQEKQTWPEGFCGTEESILDSYYARFFA